jgi:pSer/pThr/pTyr-binding forkhead associated (FHA) protein
VTARDGATRLAAGALLRGEAIGEPHLVVEAGPDAGQRLPLGAEQVLGRGPGADLLLRDPAASRAHARITRRDGRWLLSDLGSKNGLRVNGARRRTPCPIAAGDELTLGATRLRLAPGLLAELERPAAAAADPPPAPAEAVRPREAPYGRMGLLAAALVALAAALLLS